MNHDEVVSIIEYPSKQLAMYALSLVNLKDHEMNTLVLRYMRGMTQEETAEQMERSKNTIQNWEKSAIGKCSRAWKGLEMISEMLKTKTE